MVHLTCQFKMVRPPLATYSFVFCCERVQSQNTDSQIMKKLCGELKEKKYLQIKIIFIYPSLSDVATTLS